MPIGSQHWVAADMVTDLVEVENADDGVVGVSFTVVNRFYHAGRPLGWFRGFAVEVDGVAASTLTTTVTIRGQRFLASEIPSLADVWWQPLERLQVVVTGLRLSRAQQHRVALLLELPLVTFTPLIDTRGVYPSDPARLEVTLPTLVEVH